MTHLRKRFKVTEVEGESRTCDILPNSFFHLPFVERFRMLLITNTVEEIPFGISASGNAGISPLTYLIHDYVGRILAKSLRVKHYWFAWGFWGSGTI